MQVYLGQRTDIGRVRKNNEDSIGFDISKGLFIVADGAGGLDNGEFASNTIVTTIKHFVASTKNNNYQDLKNAVINAIKSANAEIYHHAVKSQSKKGIGTTATALLIGPGKYFIAHVGDSRAYLIRNSNITQITKDHSKVQRMVDGGLITIEEARRHPERNLLTRGVGFSYEVDIDTFEDEFRETDTILLCSDGMWEPISDQQILETINEYEDPQEACDRLIDLANHNGGPDNISAVIAQAQGTSRGYKPKKKGIKVKKVLVPATGVLVSLILAMLLIFAYHKNPGRAPKINQMVINIYDEDSITPLKDVNIKKEINLLDSNADSQRVIIQTNQSKKIDTLFSGITILFTKDDYETFTYAIPEIAEDTTVSINMVKSVAIIKPSIIENVIRGSEPKLHKYSTVDLILSGFTNNNKPTHIVGKAIWIDGKDTNIRVSGTKNGTRIPGLKIGTYKIEFKDNNQVTASLNVTLDGTNREPKYNANDYRDPTTGNLYVK
jgi:protein phosphatase